MSKVLIKLSRLHRCDDGIQRRDELIFAWHHDRRLALLKLDRLRPVANRQPDCSKRVLSPPRTHPLLQLNELLAPRFVAKPPRDRDDEVRVLSELLLLLETMDRASLVEPGRGSAIPCS